MAVMCRVVSAAAVAAILIWLACRRPRQDERQLRAGERRLVAEIEEYLRDRAEAVP